MALNIWDNIYFGFPYLSRVNSSFSITYIILIFLLKYYKIPELSLCEFLINFFEVPKKTNNNNNKIDK